MTFGDLRVPQNFLTVKGSPFDVIIGDSALEEICIILDLGKRVAYITQEGKTVKIPLTDEHELTNTSFEDTDDDYLTSSSSAAPSSSE